MRIVHRKAIDEIDVLDVANGMESAGVSVFAITIDELGHHVYGKTTDDSQDVVNEMDGHIEKERKTSV